MRQSFNSIAGMFHGLMGRFAGEKKRAVLAVCLITLMIFMWVRVLKNKTPQNVSTLLAPQNAIGGSIPQSSNISFVELPKIKGRNDLLARDFFTVESWQDFLSGRERQGPANPRDVDIIPDSAEETSRRIAEKLELEVIDLGKKPQAFINNKLLSTGDKLTVDDGAKLYEFEVVKIGKDMVLMKCGQIEIKLKLAQTAEVTDRTIKR